MDEPQAQDAAVLDRAGGVIRPPLRELPAAGVGIASKKRLFDRIGRPLSLAPSMTGAPHHATAAAFRPGVAFGHSPDRMVRAGKCTGSGASPTAM
jgi:hypothetical protein